MVIGKFLKKNRKAGNKDIEVNFEPFNSGHIVCDSCLSQHLLSFYKPLSFAKCPKCNAAMFIPHRVSDYWLFKPLGSGGMGSVYKAIHYQNEKKYSVKLLQRDSKVDKEVVDALLNEGRIGTLFVGHANICPIVEYGNKNSEIFLVAEFLEGTRLDILIDNNGPAEEEKVLLWTLQLLSALQHIYKQGYLFRDMKPQNIIITKDKKKATLFDFGLAIKTIKDDGDEEDSVMGSPMFLPPERCTLSEEGMYSEIYSLGMVVFYCLAGKPYYASNDIDEIISMHTRKMRRKSVASMLPDINPDIVHIIEKMIKRAPADRYQTFESVYNEFKIIYDIYRYG